MECKQAGKKTETTGIDMVIFSRPWYVIPGITVVGVVERLGKQIMSQKTSNANLNEILHLGECHIYNPVLLTAKRSQRIFVSAEEILLQGKP